jgi:hypothetical protein
VEVPFKMYSKVNTLVRCERKEERGEGEKRAFPRVGEGDEKTKGNLGILLSPSIQTSLRFYSDYSGSTQVLLRLLRFTQVQLRLYSKVYGEG